MRTILKEQLQNPDKINDKKTYGVCPVSQVSSIKAAAMLTQARPFKNYLPENEKTTI